MPGNVHILIVEDEYIIAMDLKLTLEALGYQVTGPTSSGQEALELIKNNKPDLILMDIRLQGKMDGITTARRIQELYDIPIVFLTAYTDNYTLTRANISSSSAYLVKPVESPDLKNTIELSLYKHHLEQELKESRERFRELFEQNLDAIILFNRESFRVIDVNAAALSFFQFSPQELTHDFQHAFVSPPIYHSFKTEITTFPFAPGHDFFLERFILKRKDNSQVICSIKANIVRVLQENVIYCSFRDITEKIRIEQESQYLQSRLIHANKMTALGTLSSGIAHEINNPNNYIMSNTQIMQQVWEDTATILKDYYQRNGDFSLGGLAYHDAIELVPRLLHASLDGTRRIKSIIDNLKDFTRPGADSLDEPVDINKVIEFAISILHHQVKKYTDVFHFQPGCDIPVFKGNSQQIEQVFINLIQNALQALPERSCAVTVQTAYDPRQKHVTVIIHDEGVGMSPTVQERIMDPFFTTRQDQGGTGLGLYISYSILKLHQAHLEYKSQPGIGTTAIVHFPVQPPEAP